MTWVAAGTATLTAAEIAAAEAAMAAAATAAAEATAASAATGAAASAAPLVTEVAATTLPEVAGTVLPEASGILQAAPGVVPPPATPLPPAGLETVGQAAVPPAPATPLPPATPTPTAPAGIEQVAQPGIQTASGPATSDVASFQSDQSILNMMKNYQPGPTTELSAAEMQAAGYPPAPSPTLTPPPEIPLPPGPDVSAADVINKALEPNTNPFVEGFNSVTKFIKNNPFESAILGYTGLSLSGALNQRGGQMPAQQQSYGGRYSLSPNFQPGPYSQPNVYRPTYASGGIVSLQGGGGPVERMSAMNTAMNPQGGLYPQGMIDKTQYATPIQRPVSSEMVMEDSAYERSNPMLMASGGIASFAKGTPRERDSYSEFQRYHAMMEGKKPTAPDDPAWVRSVGIVDDNDPDTKYQDALTASLIRQGKINKRANMGAPTMARPTPMGTLNFNPPGTQQAASGGIMGYNLGGYADGGNPRLLKGPGDGMSDNIPAVIGRRQPARLADGEFVVPADVVSHLGNGSTDAGAKKLHEMMDKVRMARTGKKKQAPAVKPKKYMPA